MNYICPTVTAFNLDDYSAQISVAKRLSDRIHIDLMDGEFTDSKSPELTDIWLPHGSIVDIHLMYQRPMDYLEQLVKLKPNMVIVHAEAQVHHMHFVAELHKADIKAGLCILQDTPVANIEQIMHSFDHVLIFSGNLGHHGGQANLGLLEKAKQIRNEYHDVEIGWDGGINDSNAKEIVAGNVDVLNVGGYIQKSNDPEKAFQNIKHTLL